MECDGQQSERKSNGKTGDYIQTTSWGSAVRSSAQFELVDNNKLVVSQFMLRLGWVLLAGWMNSINQQSQSWVVELDSLRETQR